jgi:hypothetical protein
MSYRKKSTNSPESLWTAIFHNHQDTIVISMNRCLRLFDAYHFLSCKKTAFEGKNACGVYGFR